MQHTHCRAKKIEKRKKSNLVPVLFVEHHVDVSDSEVCETKVE